MAVGSPASALVLYLYTKSIKCNGSQITLRISSIFCILVFFFMAMNCGSVSGWQGKAAVVTFYAFREIYVSLLSTQQWAFISTTLDKSTSGYLVSFTGVVSVASAIGGATVERLVTLGGVQGLLVTSFITTVAALVCAERAHAVLHNASSKKAPRKDQTSTASDGQKESKPAAKRLGFWSDSWQLIRSHKILQILFLEAVTHQMCTNMLNMTFHNGLRSSALANDIKAKMVGRFFAAVNVASCAMQIFVLPAVLSQESLPRVLQVMPFVVVAAVLIGLVQPGLLAAMMGFGSMKVLEYSVMNSASEMIYVPLGTEVRYVGKELIKFFGHKLGKSAASLTLSALFSSCEPSLQTQAIWGAGVTIVWGLVIRRLCQHLSQADEHAPEVVKVRAPGRIPASRSMPLFEVPDEDDEYSLPQRDEPTLVSVSSRGILCDLDEEDIVHQPEDEERSSIVSSDLFGLFDDDSTTNESQSPPHGWQFHDISRSRGSSHGDLLDEGPALLSKMRSARSSANLHRQSDCFSKVPFSNANEEIVVLQPEPMASPDMRQRMRKSRSSGFSFN